MAEVAALSSGWAAGPSMGELGGKKYKEETDPGSNTFSFPGSQHTREEESGMSHS